MVMRTLIEMSDDDTGLMTAIVAETDRVWCEQWGARPTSGSRSGPGWTGISTNADD
jgi:hypothetical protein